MSLRANPLIPAILLGLFLPLSGRAEKNRLENLLQHNPFFPDSLSSAAIEKAPQLELRGVLVEGKVTWFNIYNADTRESAWVQRGDMKAAYLVKGYDATRNALTLEYQQRQVSVALKESKVQLPAETFSPATAVASSGTTMPPPQMAMSTPPLLASERQRLEKAAVAIRLRREERKRQVNGPPPSQS